MPCSVIASASMGLKLITFGLLISFALDAIGVIAAFVFPVGSWVCLRWLRLFGQVIRVFKWKNCSASRRGCGNVKIGFIDFQGLVGRAENSSIVFRPSHETGISTACFIAR